LEANENNGGKRNERKEALGHRLITDLTLPLFLFAATGGAD